MNKAAFLLLVALFTVAAQGQQTPRLLGTLKVPDAAFVNIGQYSPNGGYHLAITSFSPFGGDKVTVSSELNIDDLANTRLDVMGGSITWPNEPSFIPSQILKTPAVGVGGGFLVPGSQTGAITVYDLGNGTNARQAVEISQQKDYWFYHRLEWFDADGDGDEDLFTARAYKPIFGSSAGEMVWYENPGQDFFAQPWTLHHIVDGPDIFFQLHDFDKDGTPEILAAQFFSQKIVVYWTENGSWKNPQVNSQIIDDTIGNAFDVRLVDLNADGKMEILATNHETEPTEAGVFAYEIPADFKTGSFTKHTLATGFVIRNTGPGQGTPGDANTFFPSSQDKMPSILVAGDGSQEAYILYPTSTNFDYNMTVVAKYGNTVGQPVAQDVDGDGYAEFFIPSYEDGLVYAYTFKP